MVHKLGFKDPHEVVGRNLLAGGLNDKFKGKIAGVVKDFNTNSLNSPIALTVIGFNETRIKFLAVKHTGNHPAHLLKDIEKQWKIWYPHGLFEYRFYDQQIRDLYHKEVLLEKLIWVAASISILISSLGFLVLLSIMIVKRTKEIGVRKVLGANELTIFKLISTEFLKWVAVVFLITIPIG